MRKNAYQEHDTLSEGSKDHLRSMSSEKIGIEMITKKKYICTNCGHILTLNNSSVEKTKIQSNNMKSK
jgi:hypothetical protein